MAKRTASLTTFGKDLDALLKQAGKLNIREYADQASVSYKYVLQLRTMSARQPGRLYTSLLKPFVRLKVIDLAESHQLSIRHRGKPLSVAECQDLFPDAPESEQVASVKHALESRGDNAAVQPPTTLSPLYRRVFVGREAELKQVQSTFDNAISRQGSLVMVVGEPGIGKTALCEELANYVTSRGGKTLIGHCYSERSLSLPYLAFVEALGSYARSRDVIDLKKEVEAGAADIARIVPEVRERLKVEPRPKGDPEEERYRLMQSIVSFLGNIASTQPLLVILEDLHNADKGTLEMLTHVSRNLAGKRLLLIGTYRDVEVDRTHPLSSALAELRRLPVFSRVPLRGLNVTGVSRMFSSITGQEMPWGLAEAIYRQTEGNPLFVQEVVRYLVEEGVISPQGEVRQKPLEMPVEMRIPDGLRDVIGKRLSSLSEGCNKVLAVAAVIGRDFRLEVLEKVAGMTEEEIFETLEEAKKAAAIEERTGVGAAVNYRFAHSFFQQTLYEEIIAPRRIRLHQQVAKAIEKVYKTRLEEHTAELAEHFSHSSYANDLKKAVHYGEMAAKRATDVYAYGEAVRLLEHAIKVQEVLDTGDKIKRCDLLLELSDALINIPDTKRILDTVAPEAFSLAEAIGDSSRAGRTCTIAILAIIIEQTGPGFSTPQMTEWAERADRYAKPDTIERAVADMALGATRWAANHQQSGHTLLTQAVDLARRLNDPNTLWMCGGILIVFVTAPQYAEQHARLAAEIYRSSRVGVNTYTLGSALEVIGSALLVLGKRQYAEEVWGELQILVERTGHFALGLRSILMNAVIAIMDGRMENALDIARQIRVRGRELRVVGAAEIQANVADYRARVYLQRNLEDYERALRVAAENAETSGTGFGEYYLVLAHLGRRDVVLEKLDQFVVRRLRIGTPDDFTSVYLDALFLESAVLVGHRQVAELLLKRFAGSSVVTSGIFYPTCIPRHLGGACALLGRYEEARKYYDEAIKVCTDMRFRPELALSRLQLTELLLEHYPNEKKDAIEHLDFCIKEFRDMKMQPSLERALRHKEILKA